MVVSHPQDCKGILFQVPHVSLSNRMLAALRVSLRAGPLPSPQFLQDAHQTRLWVVNAPVNAGFPLSKLLEEAERHVQLVGHVALREAGVVVLEFER